MGTTTSTVTVDHTDPTKARVEAAQLFQQYKNEQDQRKDEEHKQKRAQCLNQEYCRRKQMISETSIPQYIMENVDVNTETLEQISDLIPKKINALLIGPSGAGKSSFINQLQRVWEESPSSSQAYVGSGTGEGTFKLGNYLISDNKIKMWDSRGFAEINNQVLGEFCGLWLGEYKCNQPLGVETPQTIAYATQPPHLRTGLVGSIQQRMHVPIFVFNGQSSQFADNSPLSKRFYAIYKLMMEYQITPLIVLTHADQVSKEEQKQKRVWASHHLGAPEDQVYWLNNNSGVDDVENNLVALQIINDIIQFGVNYITDYISLNH